MKSILLSLLITFTLSASAQRSFLGLSAPWYASGDQRSGLKVTHQPAYIIYNEHYCYIYRQGMPVIEFPVDRITKDPAGAETFLSDETDETPFGYYDVRIQRSTKDGNTVTIQVPKTGYVISLQYAKVYSANGEVTGHIDAKQEQQTAIAAVTAPDAPLRAKSITYNHDSATAVLMERRRISDSIAEAHVKNMKR